MSVTENLAHYIQDKGVKISTLAERTNLPYQTLYKSLGRKSYQPRPLRADELMRICDFLNLNPRDFYKRPCLEKKDLAQ